MQKPIKRHIFIYLKINEQSTQIVIHFYLCLHLKKRHIWAQQYVVKMASMVVQKMSDNLNLTKINCNESNNRHNKLITSCLVTLINVVDTYFAIIVVFVAFD